jgi:hypothetical protein
MLVFFSVEDNYFGELLAFREVSKWIIDEVLKSQLQYVVLTTGVTMKTHNYLFCSRELLRLLKVAERGDFDIVPLGRTARTFLLNSIIEHSVHFKMLWDSLLIRLGFNISIIRAFDSVPLYTGTALIIKPSVLLRLSAFLTDAMKQVLNVFVNDETLWNLVHSLHCSDGDSASYYPFPNTTGNCFREKRCMQKSRNQNLIQSVMEVLPIFFFWVTKIRVCTPMQSCFINMR